MPVAVAKAAIETGVARRPVASLERYRQTLKSRLDPTVSRMQLIIDRVQAQPKRVVFAEGEEEKSISAALAWRNGGLGMPVLIGREERIAQTLHGMGLGSLEGVEIHNARLSEHNRLYADFLYRRQQRTGLLFRDCQRLVNQGRNVFAALMVAHGHADAMVTGLTRSYHRAGRRAAGDRPEAQLPLFGLSVMLAKAAPCSSPTPPCTSCPTPRPWPTSRSRRRARRAHGPRAARGPAVVHQFRQPAGLQGRPHPRRGDASSTAVRSTSSMTARWRPTWRSTPS